MHRIKRRINIFKALLHRPNQAKGVPLRSGISSLLQIDGLHKYFIKKNLRVADKQEAGAHMVTISNRSAYWPVTASVDKLVDMYFEVFHENSHRFDTNGTALLENDVVVDIGCCEGYFAMLAIEHGASKVYCFEPGRSTGNCLKQTFNREIGIGQVDILPMLLGDSSGYYNFQEDPVDPTTGSLLPETGDARHEDSYQVEMTTLDLFCTSRHLEKLDYIKMDVEGAEPQVISGAKETIHRFAPRMAIAVYHSPVHAQQLQAMIAGINPNYRFKLKGLSDFDGVVRPVMLHCYVPEKK